MTDFTVGVSYGSFVRSVGNMGDVKKFKGAKFVEIPISPQAIPIARVAEAEGLECALHIPSYELLDMMPWLTDIRRMDQVEVLLTNIKKLISPVFNWKYIVVHYPLASSLCDKEAVERLNRRYLEGLNVIIRERGIPLFIENVAVCPVCYRPEDYDWALSVCDGLCYDIGHAYTVGPVLFDRYEDMGLTELFFKRFKDKIRCVHLYNATVTPINGYSVNIHYPFAELGADNGFMRLEEVARYINSLPSHLYIVHEPHRSAMELNGAGVGYALPWQE